MSSQPRHPTIPRYGHAKANGNAPFEQLSFTETLTDAVMLKINQMVKLDRRKYARLEAELKQLFNQAL